MKTLVIFSHSYQNMSVANKAVMEELAKLPDTEIRNLEKLYPTGQIDVAAEQAALEAADLIVIEHPIFWYATPSLLKRWFDDVWAYGWAYGTGGDKLRGKKLIHGFTTSGTAENYQGKDYDTLVAPMKTSAAFVGMDYVGDVAGFGLLSLSNPNADADARVYAKKLIEMINKAKA